MEYDRPIFEEWLFEYSTQTLIYEGKHPLRHPEYFELVMKTKADNVLEIAVELYNLDSKIYQLEIADIEDIPALVQREHKK